MIRLVGISKVHRTDDVETTALRDINLTIRAGEFLAIMGPSGCGKSTLLNIIGLMDTPSAGQYFIDDQAVAVHSEAHRAELRKRLIGVIFQSFNLIDELTVYQNVELALLYQKVPREERKKRVQEVLQRVAIEHRRNHYPQQLSGGQQQRVAIARAIVGRPRLLLADEPTGNLDSRNGDEVMAELKLLNEEGTTVVMVTHSEEYATFGSRILRMLDGAILQESLQTEAV